MQIVVVVGVSESADLQHLGGLEQRVEVLLGHVHLPRLDERDEVSQRGRGDVGQDHGGTVARAGAQQLLK